MKPIKVMSVFGTRPEAVKMAPLALELAKDDRFESLICVTAQHRQMLDGVLSCFGITPDFDLDIMQAGQTLTDITSRVLSGLGEILKKERPQLVLVHGDTTTTFSGALAAFYEKIPVGHVEAGLRTYDRYSPFPEEMNRRLTGQISEYHFAPTAKNAENLRNEGIKDNIFITGNTVIDAMAYTVGDGSLSIPALAGVDFGSKRIITLTCHRRENYGKPMENIFSAVRRLALAHEDIEIVFPVHMSPYVRETASRILGNVPNIRLIEPLGAVEMHRLMKNSLFVMTDSGGIQEEAPALGKPVIVLRRETERPEAIEAGTVALAGTDEDSVFQLAESLLTDKALYGKMACAVNPYGDGRACPRIAQAILYGFGLSEDRPEDFKP